MSKKEDLIFDMDVSYEEINDALVDETNNENTKIANINSVPVQTSEKISSKQIESINKKLLNIILGNNLSFKIVESNEFQELFDSVRSGSYKLPCPQTTYAIISDTGPNIKAAVGLLNENILKLPCASHKLNLCVGVLSKQKKKKGKVDSNNNESFFIREYDSNG
ncbi:unnamed protein product [Brachionus calyciflorus]|uniref:DUF659 domain-containing protein n=1 Tax=Brachionus calyciflorus TaxID=104777 RepID=A0A813RZ12_9BILA|nr:unnamed protein product [Brachionus calyciflorus]